MMFRRLFSSKEEQRDIAIDHLKQDMVYLETKSNINKKFCKRVRQEFSLLTKIQPELGGPRTELDKMLLSVFEAVERRLQEFPDTNDPSYKLVLNLRNDLIDIKENILMENIRRELAGFNSSYDVTGNCERIIKDLDQLDTLMEFGNPGGEKRVSEFLKSLGQAIQIQMQNYSFSRIPSSLIELNKKLVRLLSYDDSNPSEVKKAKDERTYQQKEEVHIVNDMASTVLNYINNKVLQAAEAKEISIPTPKITAAYLKLPDEEKQKVQENVKLSILFNSLSDVSIDSRQPDGKFQSAMKDFPLSVLALQKVFKFMNKGSYLGVTGSKGLKNILGEIENEIGIAIVSARKEANDLGAIKEIVGNAITRFEKLERMTDKDEKDLADAGRFSMSMRKK